MPTPKAPLANIRPIWSCGLVHYYHHVLTGLHVEVPTEQASGALLQVAMFFHCVLRLSRGNGPRNGESQQFHLHCIIP